MNYYEYAPPFFRWLFADTNIKPWELFNVLWPLSALLVILIFYFGNRFRKKHLHPKWWIVHIAILLGAFALLFHVSILDKYYFDIEFKNALAQPGIFIKKQVEADGYAEVRIYGTPTSEDFKTLKDIDPYGTDYWEEDDDKQCERNGNYDFKERFSFALQGEDQFRRGERNQLQFDKKFRWLGVNRDVEHNYAVSYFGLREDQCMRGLISKPISRYFVITEGPDRVGFGLFRSKDYIVDSWTGEEIASFFNYQKSGYFLLRRTAGLLGNTHTSRANSKIIVADSKKLVDYYDGEEIRSFKMIRYTLIPSKFFQKKQEL